MANPIDAATQIGTADIDKVGGTAAKDIPVTANGTGTTDGKLYKDDNKYYVKDGGKTYEAKLDADTGEYTLTRLVLNTQ